MRSHQGMRAAWRHGNAERAPDIGDALLKRQGRDGEMIEQSCGAVTPFPSACLFFPGRSNSGPRITLQIWNCNR